MGVTVERPSARRWVEEILPVSASRLPNQSRAHDIHTCTPPTPEFNVGRLVLDPPSGWKKYCQSTLKSGVRGFAMSPRRALVSSVVSGSTCVKHWQYFFHPQSPNALVASPASGLLTCFVLVGSCSQNASKLQKARLEVASLDCAREAPCRALL